MSNPIIGKGIEGIAWGFGMGIGFFLATVVLYILLRQRYIEFKEVIKP